MPYEDPERRRAYGREWMRRNADRAREAMRRWRAANRDADRARKRAHYASNSEREKARIGECIRRNPEGRRVVRQVRRAREVAAAGSFTLVEWRDILERCGHRCAYCRGAGPLTADHRIALSRGGRNSIDNILPACRTCNSRKGTSTEREFRVRLANERLRSTEFEVVDWWRAGEIESVS